jgi:hypothetical protein
MGWGQFKPLLAEAAVEALRPVQQRYEQWRQDSGAVAAVLREGRQRPHPHHQLVPGGHRLQAEGHGSWGGLAQRRCGHQSPASLLQVGAKLLPLLGRHHALGTEVEQHLSAGKPDAEVVEKGAQQVVQQIGSRLRMGGGGAHWESLRSAA